MTFSFLAFFDVLGSELVLGHEFTGLEQRGLGLVLIRAFCQGQQLSDFVLDVGCHALASLSNFQVVDVPSTPGGAFDVRRVVSPS